MGLPGEEMLKRLLHRASQTPEEEKRDDDKEDVMKKRIETFEKSLPIFEGFDARNQLVKIDATGGIDDIFNSTKSAFVKQHIVERPKVIFVMGGPGAGKGTQCGKLLAEFPELDSYSTGDLLRAKVKEGTPESEELK